MITSKIKNNNLLHKRSTNFLNNKELFKIYIFKCYTFYFSKFIGGISERRWIEFGIPFAYCTVNNQGIICWNRQIRVFEHCLFL